MAKTMQIKYAGKEYTLEFTRASVRKMFRDGFDIENVTKDPFVVFDLFKYAFLAHAPNASEDEIAAIYSKVKNKQSLLEKLAYMYRDPIETLLDEPEDGDEGNVEWGVNF